MMVEMTPKIVRKKTSPREAKKVADSTYATPVRRARAAREHASGGSPLIASKNSPAISPGKMDFMSPRFGENGRQTVVLPDV